MDFAIGGNDIGTITLLVLLLLSVSVAWVKSFWIWVASFLWRRDFLRKSTSLKSTKKDGESQFRGGLSTAFDNGSKLVHMDI
ncbi:hypothetical protein O9993_07115 [Vibrio lentus]|nr:hypothetical protein [Vibrio lentus]